MHMQTRTANLIDFYFRSSPSSAYFSKSEFSFLMFSSLSSAKYQVFRVQADENLDLLFDLIAFFLETWCFSGLPRHKEMNAISIHTVWLTKSRQFSDNFLTLKFIFNKLKQFYSNLQPWCKHPTTMQKTILIQIEVSLHQQGTFYIIYDSVTCKKIISTENVSQSYHPKSYNYRRQNIDVRNIVMMSPPVHCLAKIK